MKTQFAFFRIGVHHDSDDNYDKVQGLLLEWQLPLSSKLPFSLRIESCIR